MNVNDVLTYLSHTFRGRDWFYDTGVDEYGRAIVYAHYMTATILADVPDSVQGIDVLVHFAASKNLSKDSYVKDSKPAPFSVPLSAVKAVTVVSPPKDETESEPDMAHLTQELDRLEKVCGSNILQDIFYETHDGVNAVTNLSARYPDVRESLQMLYKTYGFDLIYEELDG